MLSLCVKFSSHLFALRFIQRAEMTQLNKNIANIVVISKGSHSIFDCLLCYFLPENDALTLITVSHNMTRNNSVSHDAYAI